MPISRRIGFEALEHGQEFRSSRLRDGIGCDLPSVPMIVRQILSGNLPLRAWGSDHADAHHDRYVERDLRRRGDERPEADHRAVTRDNVARTDDAPSPAQLHGTGQAAHPGRDRPCGTDRRDRGGAAAGGALLVPADRLAPPTGRRSLQRPVALTARPQAGRRQPAGRRVGRRKGRERAASAPPRTGGGHHRSPKKVADLLGSPLLPSDGAPSWTP